MNQLSVRNQKFYEKVEGLVQNVENNAYPDNVKSALENMTALEKCILEWMQTQPGFFKVNLKKRADLKRRLAAIRTRYQEIDHDQETYERDGKSAHRESEFSPRIKLVKSYLNTFIVSLKQTLSAIEKYDQYMQRPRPTKPPSKELTLSE